MGKDNTVTGTPDQNGTITYAAKYVENSSYTVLSNGYTENKLIINFEYPINKITYSAWLSESVTESHYIKLTAGQQIQTTDLNNDEGPWYNKKGDDYQEDKTLNITDQSIRSITFEAWRNGSGLKNIYLKNIFLYMAPHTIKNTQSLSFNTAVTDEDGETQNIDFYSFLSGSNGIQISIVDVKDAATTIEGLSLSKTSIAANTLEKIGENKHSFTLTFKPTQIIENATCAIKIVNTGAAIGDTLYIPVTLNSSLATPTLTCDEFGYKYAKLSWNAIEGAEKYKLYVYQNDKQIKTYETTNTSLTITENITYNSTYSFRVTSIKGNAESNQSDAVSITTQTYPQIQNINFTDITQNSFTVNWNTTTNLPANHEVVQYHIHLYKIAAGSGPIVDYGTTTDTKINFSGLIDNTQYTAYVDIEYKYTLDGQTYTVLEQWWSNKSITTPSFIINDEAFDGVKMYQGVWYRVNLGNIINISSNTAATNKEKVYTMQLNYPCEPKVDFQINTSEVANIYGTANIKIDECLSENCDNPTRIHAESYKGLNQSGTANISGHNTKTIEFYCDGGANSNEYIHDIWLTIAPHLLLKQNDYITITESAATQTTSATINFGEIEIGGSRSVPVNFKSFLTSGKLTVTSNNPFITINNGKTTYTIEEQANTLCKIDNNKYNFTVTCQPTSAGQLPNGTIIITDGKKTVTLNVVGSCKKKTNIINWNGIETKLPVGEAISLAGVTVATNTTITFTSSDETKIKVENNQLITLAEGEVTITATAPGNDEYENAASSLVFEATSKIIQNIVWNQNFYLLKLGGADITLDAYAIDKKTGEPNDNLIEYSIAEGGENVVTIDNKGILHIVGKGQTRITAHQRGTDEYAGAYMTKVVIVREVSDGCEDPIIKELSEPRSKDGGFNWDTIYYETATWTTIPDQLTFTINCSDIATEYLFDVGGAKLEIVDQNDQPIYGPVKGNGQSKTHTISLNSSVRQLKFTLTCNLDRSISNIIVTPAIYVEKDRESINFAETEIGISKTEIVNIDWANQPDGLWATIENDDNSVFSITQNSYFGGSCGDYGKTPISVQFLSNVQGEFSGDLVVYMGYDNPVEQHRIPLSAKSHYFETTFNRNGNWNDPTNWTAGIPMGMGKNATISANATITDGYTAIANNITIANGGSITISPQGKLKINTVTGATATNFTLKADENGSAIFLFKNDEKNKVNATIELYSKASSDGLRNGQAGNFKNPKWQYLGIAAESLNYSVINPKGTSNWVYQWDETQNATSCWAQKLNHESVLLPWVGYCIAQKEETTYTYTGSLINSDHTYPLTYTEIDGSSGDLGNNLLTNSYTAPISITTLSESNFTKANAEIYIYNTGSYLDWKYNSEFEGFAPGQVIVIPVNTISQLGLEYPRTIASMQAFFVKATDTEASFMIDYENNVYDVVWTKNQIRTRKSNKIGGFNTLKIKVTSSTSNDRLYLIEHENTTNNFDNGYETKKIFDNPNGPQIYATTSFGYTSINCDTSFNGQSIGFVANDENEIYTISFDIEKLHNYEQLWLFDTENNLYIDILNNETYQFYASTTPNDHRFYITTINPNATQEPTTNIDNITSWNDILSQDQSIYLYSITGQLIGEYNQQSNLPSGMYLMKSGNKIIKLIIK